MTVSLSQYRNCLQTFTPTTFNSVGKLNSTSHIHRQNVTLSAFSKICRSATNGERTRRPSAAETRTPFSLSLRLPRTTYDAHTR